MIVGFLMKRLLSFKRSLDFGGLIKGKGGRCCLRIWELGIGMEGWSMEGDSGRGDCLILDEKVDVVHNGFGLCGVG